MKLITLIILIASLVGCLPIVGCASKPEPRPIDTYRRAFNFQP